MKYIENDEAGDAQNLMEMFETVFLLAFEEICSDSYDTAMPHLSSYFTQLIILIDRGIIFSENFRVNILQNQEFDKTKLFLENWYEKMSFLILNYARRINQLAIIETLPLMSKDIIAL